MISWEDEKRNDPRVRKAGCGYKASFELLVCRVSGVSEKSSPFCIKNQIFVFLIDFSETSENGPMNLTMWSSSKTTMPAPSLMSGYEAR